MKERPFSSEGRNWTALFSANFLSVFNDNFLKHCIIFIAVTWAMPSWLSQSQLISLVSAALVIPYLICSPLAGKWAIQYNKQKLFRRMKLIELPVIMLACVAFYFQWVILAITAVLLMGFLSCLYSPAKYSLIRDIGGESKVSFGSGMIEAMAFLGILIGTVMASVISDHYQFWGMTAILIGLALLGYAAAAAIRTQELPESDSGVSSVNPITFLKQNYRFAAQHKGLNTAVLGYSIFWLLGGMLQMNLIIHCRHALQISNTMTGVVLSFAAIGIAAGCTFVGKISKERVRTDLVAIGLAGMSLLLIAILCFKMNVAVFSATIFVFAFLGGFVQVPCLAHIQHADIGRKLGDMMAYLNFVTFIFVLLGTLLFSVVTMIFTENSYAVFGTLLAITALSAVVFYRQYNRKG